MMSEHEAKSSASAGAAAVAEPPVSTQRSAVERKGVYLRTVYPLNPGIPHYLDFPQGRE
jgi:hypothetical protein